MGLARVVDHSHAALAQPADDLEATDVLGIQPGRGFSVDRLLHVAEEFVIFPAGRFQPGVAGGAHEGESTIDQLEDSAIAFSARLHGVGIPTFESLAGSGFRVPRPPSGAYPGIISEPR